MAALCQMFVLAARPADDNGQGCRYVVEVDQESRGLRAFTPPIANCSVVDRQVHQVYPSNPRTHVRVGPTPFAVVSLSSSKMQSHSRSTSPGS